MIYPKEKPCCLDSGKDSLIRVAHPGELNIFGQNVPDYKPSHELYLGGEGMICTTNGYCDFLRMLLNNGELNGLPNAKSRNHCRFNISTHTTG